MPYDTYITIRNSSESILHKGSCTPQSGTVAIPPDVDISDDGSTRVVIQGDIAKRKSNGVVSYEAEIAAITTSINFTFTNDESKHTGQATANPSDHINITMETHFDESTNTLDLTYIIQPVLSRPQRDADSSIKIVNDTDTAVFCMIDSQASDEEAKFFAVAGALVAAFGFIPFAIPAVATRLAVSAAAKAAAETAAKKISWATAVLGALTAAPGLYSPTTSAERALFPSDTMTHSGGGFIRGSHNIHLLRHKLQGTSLICQYSVLKNYKKSELSILGIRKEDTKDVLKLELPKDRYRLAFYRSACIHGLSPKNQTTISMSENIKKQDYAIHFTDRRRREIDFYDLSPPKSTTASFKFEMDVSSDFIITACHNDIATQGSMYNLHYQPTGEVIALFNNWKCDYDTIEQTESAKPKEYGMQKWTNDDIFKQVLDAKNKDIFVFEEYTQYRVPGESTRLRGYKRGQISSLSYKPTTTTPEYRCFFLIPSNMVTLQQAVERVGAQ